MDHGETELCQGGGTGIADITEMEPNSNSNAYAVLPGGKGPTILRTMQVRGPKPKEMVSAFWDEGATDHFVKIKHAETSNFPTSGRFCFKNKRT